MKCRKNVKNLDSTEKRNFVRAINLLKAEPSLLNPGGQSRYDDFVKVHLDTMVAAADWTHGDSAFFPWHREMLYQFELELDRMVPGVTIPYWDWTRHQASGDAGFPFTHDFIGVDGDDASGDQVEREAGAPLPYPYEFDPENWNIVVKDFAGASSRLIRAFGERSDGTALPENDVIAPSLTTTFREVLNSASYLQLVQDAEGDHHNLVHRWVNGNMYARSSPNDPVFFMHHANIDRMWTIWQETHPGLPPYVNTSGAAGHAIDDNMIFNFTTEPTPWAGVTRPMDVIDAHTMHGDSVWYETDMPEIFEVPASTLNFGAVPEGLTQYRAAKFRVRTCRPMRFRITGEPDSALTNFDTTMLGVEFPVTPNADTSAQDVFVWFQFTASGPSPDATVTIEADFFDEEGYYAANEGEFVPLGSWTITLTANVQPREDNAVVMVLDRSGSMAAMAGGASTRSELMKSAVGVFHALMLPGDEIGIVSFDDLVDDLLPLTTAAAGLGTTLTGSGLTPRRNTAIGQGIQLGSSMLAGASHSNRSMVVLTDGNENVAPYVADLPAGTVTNRTYAVGFGLPGHVSDAVLNQITANTGGDLIVTGELTALDDQFLLTKYFVQMLAGVTSANVVLDPGGTLNWGSTHKIPFQIAGADLEIDVIGLCPVPHVLDFWLETPTGAIIRPEDAAGLANVTFRVANGIAFYRLMLPALPGDPAKSHAGQWSAHLRLADRDVISKLLSTDVGSQLLEQNDGLQDLLKRGKLPYQMIVHTRSNLTLSAALRQNSLEPGAPLDFTARLMEYGVPYPGNADVRAELIRPDGSEVTVPLVPSETGVYAASVAAKQPGMYRARLLAVGATSAGHAFTREKTMTATIFSGGDTPRIDPGRDGDGAATPGDFYCRLLDCLLRDNGVQSWLKRQDLDAKTLRKCVQAACRKSGVKPGKAKTITAGTAQGLDVDRVARTIRRELMAAAPPRATAQPAQPIKRSPPDAATKRLAKKDLKEPFPPSDKALKQMKKPSSKGGGSKKGK